MWLMSTQSSHNKRMYAREYFNIVFAGRIPAVVLFLVHALRVRDKGCASNTAAKLKLAVVLAGVAITHEGY